jgi:hypothetical protein
MTKIQHLRAAMMSGNCFSSEERGKLRWLAPGMEAQRQVVLEAVGMMHELSDRMRDCGEGDAWGGIKYCGVPTCPRCFMRLRARETGRAIKQNFDGATNEQLGFFTILLPLTARLSDVDGIIATEKTRLRNMFARKRRADDRWNAVHLVSWWEMDRTTPEDLVEAKRNSGLFYEQIGAPIMAMPGQTLWRPHLHGIVHLGDMPVAEFAETLRGYGHGAAYQVDVQGFDPRRPVERNIQSVVRYALKFRIEEDYKYPSGPSYAEAEKAERLSDKDRRWWSPKDIKSYTEWLMLNGRKRSLRFVINKKETPSETHDVVSDAMLIGDVIRIMYEDIIQDTNWLSNLSDACNLFDGRRDLIAADHLEACANHVMVPLPDALDDQGRQSPAFAADIAEAALRADRWMMPCEYYAPVPPPALCGPEGLIERPGRVVRCGNG